ncbi:MAG: metal-transporting ATPase, partial [Lachnospiraceae bacterium]|nr:metal-transporting ATPase [Lachnospiraceae bacterium]
PMFGAAAMSLSSFCVVTNALRLNLVDIYSTKRDRKRAADKKGHIQSQTVYSDNMIMKKGEVKMTKTMKIEGMMCGHCEARVKKCLEALEQVTEAVVSHEAGTAVLTLGAEVSDEVLKKTVEEQDYKVIAVE